MVIHRSVLDPDTPIPSLPKPDESDLPRLPASDRRLGDGSVARYRRYSEYLGEIFGGRTYKVTVASGLSCPTRDGSISKGGCAFCDVRGSSSFHGKVGRGAEIQEQLTQRIPAIRKRFDAEHFLAYFQSYTNTHSDLDYLEEIYTAALAVKGVSGLCIGTRPDCLGPGVIELLESLAQKHYVSLELGVQSLDDSVLTWLARGHDARCSVDALALLRDQAPSVHTCAHLMFGCPGEPEDLASRTAIALNKAGCQGVKLHQLMILKNTELEERHLQEPIPMLSVEQYGRIVADLLNHLDPAIYVERLYALATHPDECIGPEWSKDRWATYNRLSSFLDRENVIQGSKLPGANTSLPGQDRNNVELRDLAAEK